MSILLSKSLVLSLCLIFSGLLTVACAGSPAQNQASPNETGRIQQTQQIQKTAPPVSQEEAQAMALNFLESCPTFRFDGIPGTIRLIESEPGNQPNSWVFYYEFQNRQAGYGNRTEMISAQVITEHRAKITVDGDKVISATIDDNWDELNQRKLEKADAR